MIRDAEILLVFIEELRHPPFSNLKNIFLAFKLYSFKLEK